MPEMTLSPSVDRLLKNGVVMPDPAAVQVDDAVVPERVAPGVWLHPGTRLRGAETSIGPGCEIGREGPATLEGCQLGHGVAFKGGYAAGCVFLDRAEMGSGAHLRSGTLLEEQACGAHAVGLKQTILLSYVTLGSLINFCDVLMAGGTRRTNHSEVGSSFVHFNFTPHGDKATPSLIGDVPRGVLLDQAPIFLGGQGGLVGPARIEYGVVTAAGTVQRGDALSPGFLYNAGGGAAPPAQPHPYPLGRYGALTQRVRNNLIYIGNIRALQAWYRDVRPHTMSQYPYREACRVGALQQLDGAIQERLKRLDGLAEKMPRSMELLEAETGGQFASFAAQQKQFMNQWPAMREALAEAPDANPAAAARTRFLEEWSRTKAETHTGAVQSLPSEAKQAATDWLQSIVDHVSGGFAQ